MPPSLETLAPTDPPTMNPYNLLRPFRSLRRRTEAAPRPMIPNPGVELDPEFESLFTRLVEIRRILAIRPIARRSRSPSPEPAFDNIGITIIYP